MSSKSQSNPQQRFNRLLLAFIFINLVISVVSLSLAFKRDSPDIVYVDALKLITNYKGLENARKEIVARNESFQVNLDTLKAELNNLTAAYNRIKSQATAATRSKLEDQLREKQAQVMEYEQVAGNRLQQADKEISAKILEKVNDYIRRYGEAQGYTIVLAATQYGNVAYGDKSLDITDKVLVGLNAEYERMN